MEGISMSAVPGSSLSSAPQEGGGCPWARRGIPRRATPAPRLQRASLLGVLRGPCLPASSQFCPPCPGLQSRQHLLPGEQPRSPKPGAWKRRCMNLRGDSGTALAGFPGASCQAGRETCCDRQHLLMLSFVCSSAASL